MSEENMEDVELLEFYLEEFPEGISLDEILRLSRSCVLDPKLEKSLKRVMREHKEELIDYLNGLRGRARCRAGFAFSYGVLGLIDNFEQVYGLEGEVEVSKKKSTLLNSIKRKNFKNPPEGLELGLVPRRLTVEHTPFADDYMSKVQRELVPEIERLGLGKQETAYVIEKTQTLLQSLSMLKY